MRPYRPVIIVPVLVLFSAAAWAEMAELPLTDDTYINRVKSTQSFGARDVIVVHNYGPKDGLVRFDTSGIAGLSVSKATMTFYLREIETCGAFTIYVVTSPWVENGVTYSTRPSFEFVINRIEVQVCPSDLGEVDVDVTDIVQAWAFGATINYGLLLRTSDPIKAKFDSKEREGGTPTRLSVTLGPPEPPVGAIVLDYNDPDSCAIFAPGYYILDRSWDFDAGQGACRDGIQFGNEGITVDLRGHEIKSQSEEYAWPPNYVEGTLRNGKITGFRIQTGSAYLENLQIVGGVGANLGCCSEFRLVNSSVSSGVSVGGEAGNPNEAVIENSYVEGRIRVDRLRPVIRSNRVIGISILSSPQGVIVGNDVTISVPGADSGVGWIDGIDIHWTDGIIVAWNTVGMLGAIHERSGGIQVSLSSGVILEGNIVHAGSYGLRFINGDGLGFGNYYGNNRASAETPFALTDGQIDWGGNVSF